MKFVIDASVACKWYYTETSTPEARSVLVGGARLIAPDLILAEVGNVVWKRVRCGESTVAHARAIIADLANNLVLVPMSSLFTRALAFSLELDHPIYDCFYLAASEQEPAPLLTSDRKLLARLKNSPWARQVIDVAGFKIEVRDEHGGDPG